MNPFELAFYLQTVATVGFALAMCFQGQRANQAEALVKELQHHEHHEDIVADGSRLASILRTILRHIHHRGSLQKECTLVSDAGEVLRKHDDLISKITDH